MKRLHTLSQHFLRSPRLIAELVGHTSIKRGDTVYDIGAGSGAVTGVLAGRCKQVVAIEVDPRMAATLRRNTQGLDNVTVIEGDALALDLPRTPYKVFSNIPFNLSSAIVHKLTEAPNPPDDAYLIVQKQFASKLLPESDRFTSQLGVIIGPEFAVRIRRPLHRSDFAPPPNVDTVLLEIKRRPVPLVAKQELAAFKQFVAAGFAAPHAKTSDLTLSQWILLFESHRP